MREVLRGYHGEKALPFWIASIFAQHDRGPWSLEHLRADERWMTQRGATFLINDQVNYFTAGKAGTLGFSATMSEPLSF